MAGPCSLPEPNEFKYGYDEYWDIVCDKHFTCTMNEFDKDGNPVHHEYVTYREWLFRRNRLRTGKTV